MRKLYRTHRRLTLAAAAATIALVVGGGVALAQTIVGAGTTFLSPLVTANDGDQVAIAEAGGFLFELYCGNGGTELVVENVAGGEDSHIIVTGNEDNDFDEGETVVMVSEGAANAGESTVYGIVGSEPPGSILQGQGMIVNDPVTNGSDCVGGITIHFGPRPGQVSRGG